MNTPGIESVPGLWSVDGSLRDIYFLNASPSAWERFVEFVKPYPTRYTFDGQLASMPSVSEIFSNRNGGHLLSISVGQVTLHCHFFIESEIELDAAPKEVTSQPAHEQVLQFVQATSLAIGLTGHITPENCVEQPFLSFTPESKSWVVHG